MQICYFNAVLATEFCVYVPIKVCDSVVDVDVVQNHRIMKILRSDRHHFNFHAFIVMIVRLPDSLTQHFKLILCTHIIH